MSTDSRLIAFFLVLFTVVAFYAASKRELAAVMINKDASIKRRLAAASCEDQVRETLRIGLDRNGNGGYVGTSLSDMAYLDHCNFHSLDHDDFVSFDLTMTERPMELWTSYGWSEERIEAAHQEFTLELLEIYAQSNNICNFANYKPTVPEAAITANVASTFQQIQAVSYDNDAYARLAIVIVAHKDVNHLFQLVDAVHMPQHYVIIHLERRCEVDLERDVQIRAQVYDNVMVLKFGSILYKTDLVTTVNLRIMRYLVMDLQLQYDYHITLDGAAYPLYSAHELSAALKHSGRHVFLGEVKHFGRKVDNIEWAYNNVLHRFSLSHTFDDGHEKGCQPLKVTRDETKLPVGDVKYFLKSKTNSGNTAVYSYDTLQKLLSSSTAMKIHSIHKYGCCHYPEETEWYAMVNSLFLGPEAVQVGSMYQVWQETLNRRGSKSISTSNAVLTSNADTTFILADAYRRETGNVKYNGTDTKEYLQDAKRRGFLFARKFDSSNYESVELRHWIQRELHESKRSPFFK